MKPKGVQSQKHANNAGSGTNHKNWYAPSMADPPDDLPPPNPLDAVKEVRVHKSLRLPRSLWQRLEVLSKQSGAEVTALVEQAIRYYFQALDRNHQRKK